MVSVYWEVWPFQILKQTLRKYWIHINSINDYLNECEKLREDEKNIHKNSEVVFTRTIENLEDETQELIYIKQILERNIDDYITYVRLVRRIKIFLINRKIDKIASKNLHTRKNKISYKQNISHKLEKELLNKKRILEEQKNNYYGALGEIAVQKEIQKLYLESKLLNNFEKRFSKAIAMRWWHDWIYSIQIDHIVINQKWIFLIETKNWSKAFEKTQTFTPLKQAKRHWHWFYFFFREKFKQKIWFYPRIYNIVARKQHIENSYSEKYNTYEMSIDNLNYFIETRKNNLNNIQVDKIFKELKPYLN